MQSMLEETFERNIGVRIEATVSPFAGRLMMFGTREKESKEQDTGIS
jgi:hypothetical protein